MGVVVRLVLIVAGALTALVVARDALNFPILQGTIAILLIVAAVFAFAWLNRRR
ncbi:MAG: hypothetical protein ACM30I_00850 [Gemmatimonas sp.]